MVFKEYLEDIENFYRNNGIDIDPLPDIKINNKEVDIYDPFIKTGYYNPDSKTIVLNINKR